jgi:hypothetical protein
MSDWAARVVVIRTTDDGGGRACGIVTGMGATPVAALGELRREAQELAQQEGPAAQAATPAGPAWRPRPRRSRSVAWAATPTNTDLAGAAMVRAQGGGNRGRAATAADHARGWGGLEPASSEPQVLRFEVVDVRLTPGVMEGGVSGWLAYGTLIREGGS